MKQGTVEYNPTTLKKIIERCEEVILPAAEAHEKGWEEWEEKATREAEAIEKELDIKSLRKRSRNLYENRWEPETKVIPVTYKFLWWEWEKNVIKFTQRDLNVFEHIAKIIEELERELPDSSKIVYEPTRLTNNLIYQGLEDRERVCYKFLESFEGLVFYIKIKGTVPCPSLPKDKYTNNIVFLKQAKMLINLPNSESIILSEDQVEQLNNLLKTTYELEKDSGNT